MLNYILNLHLDVDLGLSCIPGLSLRREIGVGPYLGLMINFGLFVELGLSGDLGLYLGAHNELNFKNPTVYKP